jgi:endonuclease/exonuclease/phosphatase family metal-dependent hydrolase
MVMAVLDAPGSSLRVASVHLGLGPVERPSQLAQLVGLCKGFGRRETILLGDFNEWKPFGRTSRRLTDDLGAPPLGPTFPVGWRILGIPIPPLLQLDRIGLSEDLSLVDAGAHVSDLARTASDHLPLVGVVERV